jgi:ATP-binding cassette subfamily C (CFTR/MRP) protein 1
MIAGRIGSGKLTLLKGIFGELPFEGNIPVTCNKVAYCAQTPWLLDGSIRQDECGFGEESDINEVWYQTIVHACALNEDIESFPNRDESMIGNRGLTLSGGQRQRLVSIFILYNTNHYK